MAEPNGVYIGLDLGTSSLKGVGIDASGDVLARASCGYPTSRPSGHAAEQAPPDWIAAIEQVTAQLAENVAPGSWQAIGLSAMIPTLVTADANGEPIGAAITWEDSRAQEQADQLRERCGADDLYRTTGQWVDGRYLLPMFLRLAEAEPGRAAATCWLLGAKDYLFGWLTGHIATDPSTAAGFGCYQLETGRWDDDVLAATASLAGRTGPTHSDGPTGIAGPTGTTRPGNAAPSDGSAEPDRWRGPALPPVLPSVTTRPLRAAVARRLGCGQIPVCLGAADSVLGALGLGVRAAGQIGYIAGTSTVILGVTDRLRLDPLHRFLVTPLAEPGSWGLEMDLLATGSALRWLAGLLGDGLDEAGVIAIAAETDPADAPVLLPYLSPGEQGALWDPLVHGAITGLTFGHGRPHLARALVNGIVLESRRCLAVLDETGPFGAELQVAGGSAAESSFRSDLADATGRRVVMPDGPDTDYSARGAALLAAQSVGQPLPASPGTPSRPADSVSQPDGAVSQPGSAVSQPRGAVSQPDGVVSQPDGVVSRRPAAVSEPDAGRAGLWDQLWTSYEHARRAITDHDHRRGDLDGWQPESDRIS